MSFGQLQVWYQRNPCTVRGVCLVTLCGYTHDETSFPFDLFVEILSQYITTFDVFGCKALCVDLKGSIIDLDHPIGTDSLYVPHQQRTRCVISSCWNHIMWVFSMKFNEDSNQIQILDVEKHDTFKRYPTGVCFSSLDGSTLWYPSHEGKELCEHHLPSKVLTKSCKNSDDSAPYGTHLFCGNTVIGVADPTAKSLYFYDAQTMERISTFKNETAFADAYDFVEVDETQEIIAVTCSEQNKILFVQWRQGLIMSEVSPPTLKAPRGICKIDDDILAITMEDNMAFFSRKANDVVRIVDGITGRAYGCTLYEDMLVIPDYSHSKLFVLK
eukprot:PhF_6_TR38856/c0_g1_i1/m.58106